MVLVSSLARGFIGTANSSSIAASAFAVADGLTSNQYLGCYMVQKG
jgi:hypothetical protein